MSSSRTFSALAGGTINPCCFVTVSTAANNTVLQTGTGGRMVGISQEGSYQSPNYNTTSAAISTWPVKVYPPGEVCLLKIGTGGCTSGDFLKSDTNGNGVTGTVGTDICGAIALETANAGEFASVLVNLQYT
jgi:hypothetical protein